MNYAEVYLNGVALIAPGSERFEDLSHFLQSGSLAALESDWKADPTSVSARTLRRLSPQTLLAMAVAEKIRPGLGNDAAWVFSSAYSEGETLKVILDSICTPDMAVRPVRFQNSVHNAASGQWTVATQIRSSVTSLCCGDASVGAGLLKAIMQVRLEQRSVGLVVYDVPLPFPLYTVHRMTMPAGVGLTLSPKLTAQSFARINVSFEKREITPVTTAFGKQALATFNPAFAILPLFERLCGIGTGSVVIDVNGATNLCLRVERL